MNVLLVTSIFPPEIGGPATYCYYLAQSLVASHRVTVITFSHAKDNRTFKILSVNKSGNTLRRQWRMMRTIWKEAVKCDVIFTQDPLVVGLAAALTAVITHKPLVVKFVGDIIWEDACNSNKFARSLEEYYDQPRFKLSDRLKIAIQRKVLDLARIVITPSKYLRDFLVRYHQVTPDKIEVIYNGVEIKDHQLVKRDPALAITAARLVPWKGIGQIIKAVAQTPRLKYWIIGEGPERKELARLVKDLHLSNRIKFLGNLGINQVQNKLQLASIYIMNSSYEGLPHVLLEAAAAKNKIIAPSLPGVKEIFSSKEAWLFKPDSEEGFLSVIKKALKDKTKKAENAFQKVVKDFTWAATFQKTEDILKLVANK